MFYKYYIELENFRHQLNISINMNVFGQIENCFIIPLLFEPIVGNAAKYTKHDGTGQIDIEVDATHLPELIFHCKNNLECNTSNIVSSENGLKILEQRLDLCYKNNYTLKITKEDNVFDVLLSIKVF